MTTVLYAELSRDENINVLAVAERDIQFSRSLECDGIFDVRAVRVRGRLLSLSTQAVFYRDLKSSM